MSNDMMPNFELFQPATLEDAFSVMGKFGDKAWPVAGAKDSLDWFKDRIKRPQAVIDLTGIDGLTGVTETADGVEIGALTTLTDIENNPILREKYGLLSEAVSHVASPQIRNSGTLGGNASQDARCWYYRSGVPCYRAGGNTCFADTPAGQNREHAIYGASRCVAVTPSDSAPALVALEAEMVIENSGGQRVVSAEDYFIGPDIDITHMTVLKPGDILTHVRLPKKWEGAAFYFEKVTDRKAWDFPLVNIASVAHVDGGTIADMRMVMGAIACKPWRLPAIEEVVAGQPADDELAQIAGQSAARGATPLNYNHFKIPLMQNLVKRAVASYAA